MNHMATLHQQMSRHVVTIKINVRGLGGNQVYENYDGTVLSSSQDCLYIIAASVFRNKIDRHLILVELPNGRQINIARDSFDMSSQDTGIIGIRCTNPTPGVECGFGDLDPITICEDPVQELHEVYTYSHNSNEKLLTPGWIMLEEEDSFDHDCERHTHTHHGSPVINRNGHFVGFCFSHKGYLISYNMREVADRIERNQGRQFRRIAVTFQHLRQQCRVIGFYLRHRVVYVKIQRIGQPVALASWENLEEFRQQHPAFLVDEEIEQEIQQAVTNPMLGHYYVRDRQRRRFFQVI